MTEQAGSDANECRDGAEPVDNVVGQDTWEAALAPGRRHSPSDLPISALSVEREQ
jgi:hypothetical protein